MAKSFRPPDVYSRPANKLYHEWLQESLNALQESRDRAEDELRRSPAPDKPQPTERPKDVRGQLKVAFEDHYPEFLARKLKRPAGSSLNRLRPERKPGEPVR